MVHVDPERIESFFARTLERYHELVELERNLEAESSLPTQQMRAIEVPAGAEARLLIDDVITLFGLGDLDGGLISLERLLLMYPDNDRVIAFLKKYHDKILQLYENVYVNDDVIVEFGPGVQDKKLAMFSEFEPVRRIQDTVRDVDDGRMSRVLEKSPYEKLITLALINFLSRPKILSIS